MTRLIKKYKNRRLYDTEKSQYITVEELQRYIIDGIAFRVEDSVTNNDITNATLLQIFVEMESGASQFLSADMLKQLIILANHPMSQSFKKMLEQLFVTLEKSLQGNPYLSDYKTTSDLWSQQMQQFLKQWQGFFK
ncbi:polyhydroxyalkanoate biosynthesis repressor PhaR [Legionella taurinensis]|uniref:Polyhydroxyalkanoate biosynthesis repressor PhaR n=1 Tax=Legionella taurinensis TaxID=70611 RepID=A0A3A5L6H0_9GAMM|nr:polyhydroxyalkanoate synthesis regulator DNA-binding domain-containing protein [Legionella taurinensis]MDX1837867.1 polyhydroxyalkanoate synthesis regulator DNA-binding domain-containing protein [Legionella taurinensis]PUT39631.1 polyhydroxyalkanoate biosynthesis repressor PhaR [Legionella taurinensis]PUT43326.1 polyhydroxyalkanoate biosynthesis repressor PhaR [Legionella taurinensis]PUT45771.1 polyhydroxyalkanoate biosynthesis repressor PhaR [Legionella taurinensis]PUT47683.1 polyhydroxyal